MRARDPRWRRTRTIPDTLVRPRRTLSARSERRAPLPATCAPYPPTVTLDRRTQMQFSETSGLGPKTQQRGERPAGTRPHEPPVRLSCRRSPTAEIRDVLCARWPSSRCRPENSRRLRRYRSRSSGIFLQATRGPHDFLRKQEGCMSSIGRLLIDRAQHACASAFGQILLNRTDQGPPCRPEIEMITRKRTQPKGIAGLLAPRRQFLLGDYGIEGTSEGRQWARERIVLLIDIAFQNRQVSSKDGQPRSQELGIAQNDRRDSAITKRNFAHEIRVRQSVNRWKPRSQVTCLMR